jgi:hypothetical protein
VGATVNGFPGFPGNGSCPQRPIILYSMAMPRELVWKDQPRFHGWGCSRCSWVFDPPAPPVGENFDAVMRNFQAARDEAFDWHVCDKPIGNQERRDWTNESQLGAQTAKSPLEDAAIDERGYGVSN